MSKRASYSQKVSIYYRIWKSNHSVSISSIQNRYQGTKYSMRRQDIGDILRGFKNTDNYNEAKNSTRYSRLQNVEIISYESDVVRLVVTQQHIIPEPRKMDNLFSKFPLVLEDYEYLTKNVKNSKTQLQIIYEIETQEGETFTVSTSGIPSDLYDTDIAYEQLETSLTNNSYTGTADEAKYNWIRGYVYVWN